MGSHAELREPRIERGRERLFSPEGSVHYGDLGEPSEDIAHHDLQERDIAVMGSDTGNDVTPTQSEIFTTPVHQVFIPAMGGWILDNAWLDDLADECARRGRWEFLINILPLRLNNVTGSPVNPVAVF